MFQQNRKGIPGSKYSSEFRQYRFNGLVDWYDGLETSPPDDKGGLSFYLFVAFLAIQLTVDRVYGNGSY